MAYKRGRASTPSSLLMQACIGLRCFSFSSACKVTVKTLVLMARDVFIGFVRINHQVIKYKHVLQTKCTNVRSALGDGHTPASIFLLRDAPESRFGAVHLLPRQQLNKTSRRAADESDCEPFGSVSAVNGACRELSGSSP